MMKQHQLLIDSMSKVVLFFSFEPAILGCLNYLSVCFVSTARPPNTPKICIDRSSVKSVVQKLDWSTITPHNIDFTWRKDSRASYAADDGAGYCVLDGRVANWWSGSSGGWLDNTYIYMLLLCCCLLRSSHFRRYVCMWSAYNERWLITRFLYFGGWSSRQT